MSAIDLSCDIVLYLNWFQGVTLIIDVLQNKNNDLIDVFQNTRFIGIVHLPCIILVISMQNEDLNIAFYSLMPVVLLSEIGVLK